MIGERHSWCNVMIDTCVVIKIYICIYVNIDVVDIKYV